MQCVLSAVRVERVPNPNVVNTAIGLGVYIQKNYNTIIACLLTASGLLGLGLALYDYGSQLIAIAFIAMTISVAAIGVSILRSSD